MEESTEQQQQQQPMLPLLLACRFFDAECAGYLEAEDLEEILFMTAGGASRECGKHGV